MNADKLEKEIAKLILDDDVNKKSGIYPYTLTRNEKYLSIRSFTDSMKQKVYEKHSDNISSIIIIVPNKRSQIFLKKEISRVAKKTIFSPIIYDIESFMSIISGIEKISDSELLFEFYNIYLNNTKEEDQQTFEEFVSWAKTLLNDFSEIDRELCDTDSLFDYLKAFKDLTHWSKYEDETDLIKSYKEFS